MVDDTGKNARLKALPSVDEVLGRASVKAHLEVHPRPVVVQAVRAAVDATRRRLLAGEAAEFDDGEVEVALAEQLTPQLRAVLNATGVVLHTNLGRAPLAPRAMERVASAAGYCNLELDLGSGERGSRYRPVLELLRQLTGAEAALVVNNCAAAVLLTLSELAGGKDAIVSRGELVEIGGGFRVPDVMRQSQARLVEVGTTNRTRVADYQAALTPATGAVVKVHRSNFALVGFTEEASVVELAAVAGRAQVPLFVDLGSGALSRLDGPGIPAEPTVREVVAQGADVVTFSGDKLLGGPQAGIIVGRAATVARLERHPLNRALRVDKLTVAALEATLELYRDGVADSPALPARWLLTQPEETIAARAQALSGLLAAAGVRHRVAPSAGRVGGGSLPTAVLPSRAVVLDSTAPERLHRSLREGAPPVVGRVVEQAVWLDCRCIADADLPLLSRAVIRACEETAC